MDRRVRAIVCLALLSGCALDHERVWASVLANAPFIYLTGLAVLHALFEPWSRADPRLRFGRKSHWGTLAVLVGLAGWASPQARFDGVLAYWLCFGGLTLTLWLLIWRIAMAWPKSQPSRWSGAVAFALTTSPAVAGLASASLREYAEFGVVVWVFGSGLGLSFLAVLLPLAWEARQIGRHARLRAAPIPSAPKT